MCSRSPYRIRARDYVPDYAEFLRKKWNLGICDNDMVLLVSTTDRLVSRTLFPFRSFSQTTISITEVSSPWIDDKRNHSTESD